jgi:hypothetical protein
MKKKHLNDAENNFVVAPRNIKTYKDPRAVAASGNIDFHT